uniref:Uncharacterized protein n=1 Tax=Anguilla anguilla TaxID=7936 RepID=A0A0E9VNH6_ANGAN
MEATLQDGNLSSAARIKRAE